MKMVGGREQSRDELLWLPKNKIENDLSLEYGVILGVGVLI